MIETVMGALIGSLCGIIGTYLIIKTQFRPLEIMEDFVDFAVTDMEMQKKLFLLGAILGNGIKSGVGLQSKGGKFKFEDLIAMALSSFFGKQQETNVSEQPPYDYYKKTFSGR